MTDRIEKLKEFLKGNPDDSFLKHAMALEQVKLGDDEGAVSTFQEILETEPGYVGSYYHLAACLLRLGQTEKALAIYHKGMEEAKKAGDHHAYNELRAAYEDITE
ncbi:MAG: tetratricopeptide repeat protein [Chitinophagaceae bacterium]|nr:tetratricopeptide repeat protein [Chitinophagaceae bacterium]